MERETLIKKWLDHDLNEAERKAFEALEDYDSLMQLSDTVKGFTAPEFNSENTFEELTNTISARKAKSSNAWLKPLLRIAAVVLIGFSIYYYTSGLDTNYNTLIAEHTILELPDASTVNLNAKSSITFNERSWDKNREVLLDGEAFFKVAKGSKFDVITDAGTVSVLGTQFNVKQRPGYFEVTCYEGLVSVTHNKKTIKLKPSDIFAVIDGKIITNEKEESILPSWINYESSFKSRPLKTVVSEFERQYNVSISTDEVDVEQLFTGSFTHKNIELALKSITLPLNLKYKKSGDSIVLKSE